LRKYVGEQHYSTTFFSIIYDYIVEEYGHLLLQREDDLHKAIKLTTRERRFIKFASVTFDGQLYMTPQDFLDSVIEPEPRRE